MTTGVRAKATWHHSFFTPTPILEPTSTQTSNCTNNTHSHNYLSAKAVTDLQAICWESLGVTEMANDHQHSELPAIERLSIKEFSRKDAVAAIAGERIPALGLPLLRLCTIRGIRYHDGFGKFCDILLATISSTALTPSK